MKPSAKLRSSYGCSQGHEVWERDTPAGQAFSEGRLPALGVGTTLATTFPSPFA